MNKTPMLYAIPAAKLQELDATGLGNIREVIHTLAGLCEAFLCQPRFNGRTDGIRDLNPAGHVLDELAGFLHHYGDTTAEIICALKPEDKWEARAKAWAILNYEADMAEDIADFAVLAAQSARDVSEAEKGRGLK